MASAIVTTRVWAHTPRAAVPSRRRIAPALLACPAPRVLWLRRGERRSVYRAISPCRATDDDKDGEESGEEEEDWEGLTEEEDWTVPGGSNDSLSSNTQLGRAIRSACDELDELGRMEADVQSQAEELLRKLGYKGDSLTRPSPGAEGTEESSSGGK